MNEPPKYAYPYPPQGYYQGPPVMAPPQYGGPPQYTAPPPKKEHSFLKGCLAALCCCCLLDECCCDPSIVLVGQNLEFRNPQVVSRTFLILPPSDCYCTPYIYICVYYYNISPNKSQILVFSFSTYIELYIYIVKAGLNTQLAIFTLSLEEA